MSMYTSRAYKTRRPSYGTSRRSSPARGNRGNKQYIHPSKFVQAAKLVDEIVYTPTHNFVDFAVNEIIKANIIAKGYITPSPIQDQSIPVALEGKDVIGIANTGTGKTAAFAIPLLHRLMEERGSKALIIAPTRELAEQIEKELISFAKGSGLFGTLLIGGSSMGTQLRALRDNPEIVIGTPGRIKDHVERGTLKLRNFNVVVLDEVDRMLDMGFIPDIRFLLGQLADKRQSLFFSATIDPKINDLIQSFTNNPVTVSVRQGVTSDNVEQNIVEYSGNGEKISKLHDILVDQGVKKVLVFDETQRSVERLANELVSRGFDADAIHGGKTQGQRQRALKKFRDNQITILVATDVAARGIDVVDITHVINYSQPGTYDDYIHRIGRAGRAGRTGNALTFVGS
jgi:ATP-dependent RNA helicase RhlE